MIGRLQIVTYRRAAVLVAVAVMGAVVAGASGFFTATGQGKGSASVGALSAPASVTATAGAGSASISWSAVTAPASGSVTYYVRRDGGSPAGNCPSSATPASVTSCTDSGLAAGQHSYKVTAVWRSWSATSAPRTVTLGSGAAAQIVLSGSTADLSSGATRTLTATIQDSAGNTVTTGADSTASITFAKTTGTGTVTGLSTVAASNGTATDTVTGATAGPITLRANATINSAATNSNTLSFNIVPGTASTVAVFSGSGQSATVNTAFGSTLVALVTDSSGNPVSGVTVTFSAPSSGASGTFANTTTSTNATTGADGKATSSTFTANTTAGSYSVSASASGATSATFGLTNSAGAAKTLTVSGYPTPVISGTSRTFAVTAKDQFGNVATGYTGTVHFTTTAASAALPANYTYVAADSGVHQFNATLNTAGTQSITATDTVTSTITGSQTGIVVTASQLVITAASTTPVDGAADNLTITAKDAAGNTAANYTGDKSLTFSGASNAPDGTHPTVTDKTAVATAFGTAETLTFASGIASTTTTGASGQAVMRLFKAGTASISASDGSISSPTLSVTASVAATTPSGLTYNDPGSGSADTVTGSTSATTKVTATETAGPHVGNVYNATSAGNGSFTVTVDNIAGTSGSPVSVTYGVVAVDAWGNQTTAASISGSDKH